MNHIPRAVHANRLGDPETNVGSCWTVTTPKVSSACQIEKIEKKRNKNIYEYRPTYSFSVKVERGQQTLVFMTGFFKKDFHEGVSVFFSQHEVWVCNQPMTLMLIDGRVPEQW